METTLDPNPEQPAPEFGRIVTIILIGESIDGQPVVTTIEPSDAKFDLAFDPSAIQARPGTEIKCEQENFPTVKKLYAFLSKRFYDSYILSDDKGPKRGEGE